MKAVECNLLNFLRNAQQLIIPIYQRMYSWTERECLQFWNDILRVGSNDDIGNHFIGSVVYIQDGLNLVARNAPLLVIDGQQRLTTITLLLEALARNVGDAEPIDGFSLEKIKSYYLTNPLEKEDKKYKLLLTQTDKDTLISLLRNSSSPTEPSLRIIASFHFFDEKIKALNGGLEYLCKGLEKLQLVDVALDRAHDNPQLIFESMNSTGRELSQADLIRNFILMGLEPEIQTTLYNDFWRPMEVNFGQEAYGAQFDSFMRHYLTYKTGSIPKVNAVYEAFKAYFRTPEIQQNGVKNVVADLNTFADYYCKMVLGKEPNQKLAEAFHDLRELNVNVAYPLLLELYSDYDSEDLLPDEFEKAIRMIESYVFRRSACAIPTNSLNKTFANSNKRLKKDRYLESLAAYFLLLPSYRRFPSDEEFEREIKVRDLYNFRSKSYWLRRMENAGRKERVSVNDYTIEHILPQNKNVPQHWREELGDDWKRVHEKWLHTLGNLTLTGYNSEYSDRAFSQKKDMEGGFTESPLKLNEGLGTTPVWNEDAIKNRSDKLALKALEIWTFPSLDEDTLNTYRSGAQNSRAYSITDHEHLSGGESRMLFDKLRTEIMALNPCVTEEFLKLYVAYKAETNFVDVVPQKSRLRLSLNMKFHEIQDPRGLCKDVTNLGRWGNGNVEVGLKSLEELQYVVGLIRQALEKQLGNSEQ